MLHVVKNKTALVGLIPALAGSEVKQPRVSFSFFFLLFATLGANIK